MSDEKDRLGDKLREREKAEEDRYFDEQSRKQLERLREARATSAATGTAKCPRCGTPLQIRQVKGIGVDSCPKDCGIWLDQGELDRIAKREGDSWLARLLTGSPS
jgi:hypothetical protein